MNRLLPLVLLLAGCPDPEKPFDGTAGTTPDQTGQMGGQPGPAGDPGAGPSPGGASMPTLTVTPGEGVRVSGTFTYTGAAVGKLRVDIFRPTADNKPEILHAMTLSEQGPWEVELPKNLGSVYVLAFVDATGNGPDATEPSVLKENVSIVDTPVTNLDLEPKDGASNPFAIDPNAPTAPIPAPAGADVPPPAGTAPPPDGAGAPPAGDPAAASGAAPTDAAAAAPKDAAAPADAAPK